MGALLLLYDQVTAELFHGHAVSQVWVGKANWQPPYLTLVTCDMM